MVEHHTCHRRAAGGHQQCSPRQAHSMQPAQQVSRFDRLCDAAEAVGPLRAQRRARPARRTHRPDTTSAGKMSVKKRTCGLCDETRGSDRVVPAPNTSGAILLARMYRLGHCVLELTHSRLVMVVVEHHRDMYICYIGVNADPVGYRVGHGESFQRSNLGTCREAANSSA